MKFNPGLLKFNFAFAPMADRLRFTLAAAGWPGIAGTLLLVAGVIGEVLVVPHELAKAASSQAAAERSHQKYLKVAAGGGQGGSSTAQTLTSFRELLASDKQADEVLETIQRDAQKYGLAPVGTEYKWQRVPDAKLVEVRIIMPLKATYAPLRTFVKDVLVDVPGLALEQIELQRDNIGSTDVDARLRFLLYLKVGA